MTGGDRSDEFGQIDLSALRRIQDLWITIEPLVVDTAYDDLVDPTMVRIELGDGIATATTARIDVQWSDRGNYSFHYVDDEDVNWRFDHHPNTHSPEAHFHPPPDASTAAAEPSCIRVREVSLVTRAVHKMWRVAYDDERVEPLNSLSNPP
jgi:hypothetical protein